MSEWQNEIGGQKGSPYDGVLHKPCRNCGAKPGDKCTFEASFRGERKTRHIPCLSRIRCDISAGGTEETP